MQLLLHLLCDWHLSPVQLMKGADEYYVISDPSTLAPLSSYWQDWIGVMIITVAVEQRLVTYYVASDTD